MYIHTYIYAQYVHIYMHNIVESTRARSAPGVSICTFWYSSGVSICTFVLLKQVN